MDQTIQNSSSVIQVHGTVSGNNFYNLLIGELDQIKDLDSALQLTSDALNNARKRLDQHIPKKAILDALLKFSYGSFILCMMACLFGKIFKTPINLHPTISIIPLIITIITFKPLKNAIRKETDIEQEIESHKEILTMLYKKKILSNINDLDQEGHNLNGL